MNRFEVEENERHNDEMSRQHSPADLMLSGRELTSVPQPDFGVWPRLREWREPRRPDSRLIRNARLVRRMHRETDNLGESAREHVGHLRRMAEQVDGPEREHWVRTCEEAIALERAVSRVTIAEDDVIQIVRKAMT